MSDVLVKVEGVSKKFCRSLKRSLWYGVQDIFADLNPFRRNGPPVEAYSLSGRNQLACTLNTNNSTESAIPVLNIPITDNSRRAEGLRPDEFWAVNDVSFELQRGECLGLVGANGAGKTTLLKMLNGLIKPDKGRITMRGRVGALIALGAGFNPILSGRENIYVNASVLGLSKREIDTRIDEIIEFAEIDEFIDSPVQNYSSGMQVRLGFAVASAMEPEILLLDEVLAVGDIAFRVKCYNRIGRLQKNAATILVTHDVSYLSTVCNRILFMSHGKSSYYADRNAGIRRYIDTQTPASADQDSEPLLTFIPPLRSAAITAESEQIQYGDDWAIIITMDSSADLDSLQLRCTASTEAGHPVLFWDSDWTNQAIRLKRGRQVIRLVLGPIHLTGGRYSFYLSLTQPGNGQLLFYSHRTLFFEITSKEIHSEIRTAFGLKNIGIHYDSAVRYLDHPSI
jgi:lipopolysaccharide transport system ATP-binding protein